MEASNHVLSLLAFVFAVALTQLLMRLGSLVVARERIQFSGLAITSAVSVIVLIYANWLAIWEIRDQVNRNLMTISVLFLFAIAIYFVSTLAAPLATPEHPVDLDAFYWTHRKPYYWAWFACEALAILANVLLSESAVGPKLLVENLTDAAMFLPIGLALAVPRRWAQWVGTVLLLLLNLYYLVVFDTAL